MTETIYPRAPPPSSRSTALVSAGGESIDSRGFVRKEKLGEIGGLVRFFSFFFLLRNRVDRAITLS